MDLGWAVPYLLFLHVHGRDRCVRSDVLVLDHGEDGRPEPQHANFSTRQAEMISRVQVIPLAIFQGVTGVLLISRDGDSA